MSKLRSNARSQRIDPDPIVLDLLLNVAAMALAGAIKKFGHHVLKQHRTMNSEMEHAPPKDQIRRLREHLSDLKSGLNLALQLVEPGQRREMGGQILLNDASIERYHDLRDRLFGTIRELDALVEELPLETVAPVPGGKLRPEFRRQLKYVEKKLKAARVAVLAEAAMLEMQAAVATLDRALDYLDSESRLT